MFAIASELLGVDRSALSAEHLRCAMLGTPELLIIFAVVVLLFGATKLPQLGKGLGEAIGNFKRAQKDSEAQAMRTEIDATPRVEGHPSERLEHPPK